MSGFQGKRGLVFGVANKRSIAWAIARRLAEGGAELAFTYQGERIESSVRELAETVGSPLVTSCDVRSDDDVARVLAEVGETFGDRDPASLTADDVAGWVAELAGNAQAWNSAALPAHVPAATRLRRLRSEPGP